MIQVALGTGERGRAAIRAALLDAEFERVVMGMRAGLGTGGPTIGEVVAAFRDRVIAWDEAARATGPVAPRGAHEAPACSRAALAAAGGPR